MHINSLNFFAGSGKFIYLSAALTAGTGLSLPAFAQDDAKGPISGEISFEFQNDWAYESDDPDEERNDAYATIEAAINAALSESLSLNSLFVLEPVLDPEPGQDRFFSDHGIYIEELFLGFERDNYALRGGKFGQKFGIAWDAAPGIWGTDFAEDYEIAEQIGVAADLNLGSAETGAHTLTAGTFFADTTVLSDSALVSRGRTHKSDGGAGNTEDFSSFAVALEGSEMPSVPGLGYHVAFEHRGVDGTGESAETGYVGALTYVTSIGPFEVSPLIEYAHFENQDGAANTNADYLTTSVAFGYEQWNLALSRTARVTKTPGSPDVDDTLIQVSAGYAFENGIGVNAGYRQAEESGIETNTLGVLVDYAISF